MKFIKILIIVMVITSCSSYSESDILAPGEIYDLSGWKLQYPINGEQQDILNIEKFTSDHFHLNNGYMEFVINAAEEGSSKNSSHVRSELRHLENWDIKGHHMMKARIMSTGKRDKVTVAQIHGIERDGTNIPPLLRISVADNYIYAHIKSDNGGVKTEKFTISDSYDNSFFDIEIIVDNSILTINYNGETGISKDISYWTWYNYFKVGAYPQTHSGVYRILVGDLFVE